jgi:predicted HAD superfamily Cof-like phosphohydrolase
MTPQVPPLIGVSTNVMQLQVREFMLKMRQHVATSPSLPPSDVAMLRFRLIDQEAHETKEAILNRDLVEIIDGLCDLLYVAYGAAEAHGIDLTTYFNEVHRTNMLKDPDHVDEYGKVIKPPNWEKPQIARILKLQQEIAEMQTGLTGGNYIDALEELPPAERRRLVRGEWVDAEPDYIEESTPLTPEAWGHIAGSGDHTLSHGVEARMEVTKQKAQKLLEEAKAKRPLGDKMEGDE